ncbi:MULTISPECIES: hypothetical protein [unclassified Sphingomonas]|uniref:hypothetical protein n=1 Tax=unclassified Sphingomonas TaxID=196159 RepID=UPI002150A6E7|nr:MULTISPECIES: hypothetical protein [unclassified Sphingomonas]MCR5871485.1 hypothetical protein [Sphingomonas sp. J344]UUY00219.1 hypothetical protein LRS08_03585 [Sphingomonas sp. J315]
MNDTNDTRLRDRMAVLLGRYPTLDPVERDELITFIKSGPAVDRGMLKGDPATAAAIRRVEADHPEHFRLGIGRQLVVAAAIALPFLVICWLAWEVGAR